MKSRFSASDNGNAEIKKAQINKTAIVLTNLGSPDEPKAKALKVYLREFLSDPRVVEIPRLIWLFILNGIILNIRPKKSAKLYEKVWLKDGSPLVSMAESQTKKIADLIAQRFPDTEKQTYHVEVAMRYGNPSIKDVLTKLQNDNINDIILLPLYPQYASPTTGSTFDALSKVLQKWRFVPNVQFINGYHTNSTYIKALASSIREHVEMVGKPDKLVLSYHGMPELFRKNGDPYYEFCEQTTTLVKHELLNHAEGFALAAEDFVMTFQSRFGNAQWLTPYTDVTLEELAKQGHKNIAIISPAFSADCLETLEELEDENREIFMDAGGETYHYIAALNDRDDHIEAILDVLTPAIKSMAK
jgi:ferrochelatase